MAADKVQTIRDWPKPRKVKDIQSFLGFANFYQCFIYNFSDIVVLLMCLTCKNVPFVFSNVQCAAFNSLKDVLMMLTIL
jgi:hypothetical protein